jgi:hypothetical protein
MKEKFLIFLALIFLVTLLIGLNAASYVQKEKVPDMEFMPNRSSYNVGATGTRAFYDLLAETGRTVTRWQEPPSALLNYGERSPSTFVVIGTLRREFEEKEIEHLKQWVSQGGRLIIIDRNPLEKLIETNAVNWKVSVPGNFPEIAPDSNDSEPNNFPTIATNPSDQNQMTVGESASKPTQPTIFTKKVNSVQQSRFATSIKIERLETESDFEANEEVSGDSQTEINESPTIEQSNTSEEFYSEDEPPPMATPAPITENSGEGSGAGSDEEVFIDEEASPTPIIRREGVITKTGSASDEESEAQIAPVIHLAKNERNILVDFPYGSGQIVLLSDPYIVSNGGINLVDNAQLAVNIVAADGGIIAFDEYHQGFGSGNNRLLSYFEGTPVVAFFLQIAALLGLIFFTRSRRFARPLPAVEPNRLSKLEYVSAMAQLQERTKAFDLAIENVYKDFRRRVSKLVGVDNHSTSREKLAGLIAERSKLSAKEIEDLMFKCEDIIHGETTNKKEVVDLTSRLRELENELGLQRRKKVKSKK